MAKLTYPNTETGTIMQLIDQIAATAVERDLRELKVSVGRSAYQLRVELKR